MLDRRGSAMPCLTPHKLSADQRSRLLELLSDTFYIQGCFNFPTLVLRCGSNVISRECNVYVRVPSNTILPTPHAWDTHLHTYII